MKKPSTIADVLTSIGVVALIMMLVRPGSKGPALVAGLGNAFQSAATGTIGATLEGTAPAPPRAPSSSSGGTIGGGSSSSGGGSSLFGVPLPSLNPFDYLSYRPGDFNTPPSSTTTRATYTA